MADQIDPPPLKKRKLEQPFLPGLKKLAKPEHENLQAFRKTLPIYSIKNKLLFEFKRNQCLVIIGETGCMADSLFALTKLLGGKTTQIPQFLLELNQLNSVTGRIAVTQPRRIAAVSVAARVAMEQGYQQTGGIVGHHVRFDSKISNQTKLTFLTDGMLLREAMIDPLLSLYNTIVLDEAHERSLDTDILFSIVKNIQAKRKETANPLRLIIMSATLDADIFQKYFSAKVLYIQGRQYPVTVNHTITPEPNYIDAVLITIQQIHLDLKSNSGDILAFLTGQSEIESIQKLLKSRESLLPSNSLKWIICPLFGALTSAQQQKVFDPTPEGFRKIVLCTNIAETSVTVPNIKYVIDSGMVKSRIFNEKMGMDVLAVIPVSQAQARQRAGRAGRTSPGQCYRIYTESTFFSLPATSIPEILRVNLSSVILTLKMIGIQNVIDFDYISSPPVSAFRRALSELWLVGALDQSGQLSEIGKQMALFPLSPVLSKALIQSRLFDCSEEVISIIAMLSVENIFITTTLDLNTEDATREAEIQAQQALASFASPFGDHIMLLRIYSAFKQVPEKNRKKWCQKHALQPRAMKQVEDIRAQLCEYWTNFKWSIVSCGESMAEQNNYETIRKCFASAFFGQTAIRLPNGSYQTLLDQRIVYIHPASFVANSKPETVIFHESIMTSKQYMRNILVVEKDWIMELLPKLQTAKEEAKSNKIKAIADK